MPIITMPNALEESDWTAHTDDTRISDLPTEQYDELSNRLIPPDQMIGQRIVATDMYWDNNLAFILDDGRICALMCDRDQRGRYVASEWNPTVGLIRRLDAARANNEPRTNATPA